MAKKSRKLKVYGMGGYKSKDVATIMLKGKWLEELGFEMGTPILVECENGKLVITPREEEKVKVPCGCKVCVAEACKYYEK